MDLSQAWDDLRQMAQTNNSDDKVASALHLATIAFAGQQRRGGGIQMPMAVHSIRVGLQLERFGADLTTVLAGFCHDMLEDTEVTASQIETLYGADVLRLVEACSLNEEIYENDHEAGNRDLIDRVADSGPRAVFIKVVDILDNLATYSEVPIAWQEEMFWCAAAWLELGRTYLNASHVAVKALEIKLRNIDPSMGRKWVK